MTSLAPILRSAPVLALLGLLLGPASAAPDLVAPFEDDPRFVPANVLDVCVLQGLRAAGVEPAPRCSDAVFLRRAHLDLIGTLPEPSETRRFLASRAPRKRAALVDELLERDEFATWWALKWADLLRVKSEFPINLWPNAVQAYHRWIEDQIREGRTYDAFARDLLTASGSNFRVPPVNFWRAVQGREPSTLAAAVALTFLGTRIDAWPQDRRDGLAAFFSRVHYKATGEWKEEIVMPDPAPAGPLAAVLPDGTPVTIPGDEDPRRVFADWLLAPGNPWFARAIANRAWSWFFGRGVVHEPDDLRPDNPPSNPDLLACLARQVEGSGYDLRVLFRLIVTSRTYQASPVPRGDAARSEALFGHYPVRRLDAEVLMDALARLDGAGEAYESAVPEPWTFLPPRQRSIALADGSITSPFLEMFGRPARDTGLESERNGQPTEAQRLWLLNSSDVRGRIERSRWVRRLAEGAAADRASLVPSLYLALLARPPAPEEVAAAEAYLATSGLGLREGVADVVWALLNTKEFLYRH